MNRGSRRRGVNRREPAWRSTTPRPPRRAIRCGRDGYQWPHRTGFTVDAQLGVTYLVARAASDAGATAATRDVAPLLNPNVGYSS